MNTCKHASNFWFVFIRLGSLHIRFHESCMFGRMGDTLNSQAGENTQRVRQCSVSAKIPWRTDKETMHHTSLYKINSENNDHSTLFEHTHIQGRKPSSKTYWVHHCYRASSLRVYGNERLFTTQRLPSMGAVLYKIKNTCPKLSHEIGQSI